MRCEIKLSKQDDIDLRQIATTGQTTIDVASIGATNMEEQIQFDSNGLKLCGTLSLPDGLAASDRRPAFLVLHGFGSNRNSKGCIWCARTFSDWGLRDAAL